MKKFIKLFFLSYLLFYSFSTNAQVQEYLDAEDERINEALNIENEVTRYISDNIANYSLPQTLIDSVTNNLLTEHHGSSQPITGNELQMVLLEIKKEKLRELFFTQYPEKTIYFNAIELPEELKQSCVNGGFESGLSSYNFLSRQTDSPGHMVGCPGNYHTVEGYNAFIPPTNKFTAKASLVSTQNEPLLYALGLVVSTTKNGNRSIKLNPSTTTADNGDIGNSTAMYRDFIINENSIDFNFLQLGHISNYDGEGHEPSFFNYRLINIANSQTLISKCFSILNTDCRYTSIPDTRPGMAGYLIGFSGWICERIPTDQYIGMNVRLEFVVSDCTHRGHFSTVYLDNICGTSCTPTYGSINLNPVNTNCPSSSFNVCGTFQNPVNGTIGSIQLNAIDNSGQVAFTVSNPTITGNTFCFSVNPALFGNNPLGSYEFRVDAFVTTSCDTGSSTNLISDLSANTGADVSFNGCCLPNISLISSNNDVVASGQDSRQASSLITASNKINTNAIVIYHAGTSVVLANGFHSVSSSRFRAYIEGCTGSYVGRSQDFGQPKKTAMNDQRNEALRSKDEVLIYPNPSNSLVTVSANQNLRSITINSLDGKKVFNQSGLNRTNTELNISSFEKGIYILTIETADGVVVTKKLIKN